MKRTCHLSCNKGKRVRVLLRNGEIIIDKFVEKKGRFVLLEGRKLRTVEIKSFVIFKG